MNPFDILGKLFPEVEDSIAHLGVEVVFDDLELSEEQEFSVAAKDNSWEISLGKDQIIDTVFLYKLEKFSDHIGFRSDSLRGEIEKVLGQVSACGPQTDSAFLGIKGSWERYDKPEYSLHVEHEVNSENIKMVTIMLPEIAL
jgi:hypothetical protein